MTIAAVVIMVCVRGSPRAFLLLLVLYGRLIALAHSARSFALALVDAQFQQIPFSPVQKKTKCSSQLAALT